MRVTQKALAKRVGLSQSYISELESGRKIAPPSTWGKLIFHLDDEFEEFGDMTFEKVESQIDEVAKQVLRGEPWIVRTFLDLLATDLKLHFYCPICAHLRPFKCRVVETLPSFTARGKIGLDDEYQMRISCAVCLERRLHKCGGYRITWKGRGRLHRVVLMVAKPQARVSLVHWSEF